MKHPLGEFSASRGGDNTGRNLCPHQYNVRLAFYFPLQSWPIHPAYLLWLVLVHLSRRVRHFWVHLTAYAWPESLDLALVRVDCGLDDQRAAIDVYKFVDPAGGPLSRLGWFNVSR